MKTMVTFKLSDLKIGDEEVGTIYNRINLGGITQEAYDKKLSSLKEQQGLLQIELKEYTNGNYDFLTTVGATFSLAKRAREIFDSSEVEEKRQILNYLLQNPVVEGKKLYFTTKKLFNMLLNIPKGLVLGDYRESNPDCRYHKPE